MSAVSGGHRREYERQAGAGGGRTMPKIEHCEQYRQPSLRIDFYPPSFAARYRTRIINLSTRFSSVALWVFACPACGLDILLWQGTKHNGKRSAFQQLKQKDVDRWLKMAKENAITENIYAAITVQRSERCFPHRFIPNASILNF